MRNPLLNPEGLDDDLIEFLNSHQIKQPELFWVQLIEIIENKSNRKKSKKTGSIRFIFGFPVFLKKFFGLGNRKKTAQDDLLDDYSPYDYSWIKPPRNFSD